MGDAMVLGPARVDGAHIATGESWVALKTDVPHRVLSFAPLRGGFELVSSVVIVGVRNRELPAELDPLTVLRERMSSAGLRDGVGMLTSRNLHAVDSAVTEHGEDSAFVLATAGLSNAVRVGDTPGALRSWGTINLVCRLSSPMTDAAMVEALSIVAEARTAAVLELGVESRRSAGLATGTGTDCIAVLAPIAGAASVYAGKHTAIGYVVGAAVGTALGAALERWKREVLG